MEEKLTLKKFEEASEIVKKVTLNTNLIYSDYFSDQTGNQVYIKPENMQFTGAYKWPNESSYDALSPLWAVVFPFFRDIPYNTGSHFICLLLFRQWFFFQPAYGRKPKALLRIRQI